MNTTCQEIGDVVLFQARYLSVLRGIVDAELLLLLMALLFPPATAFSG
jgi:hypothetical protein